MRENHDISFFFNPKSICVIGASDKTGKVGNIVMKNLIQSSYSGKIYPVNPKEDEIEGIKVYKNISDIPDEVEIAIFTIKALFVPDIAEECGKKGV
jgi:acyl-CoA synthetase (NDP forming)